MTIRYLMTVIGGPINTARKSSLVQRLARISISSFCPVNLAITIVLFDLVGMIALDVALGAASWPDLDLLRQDLG